MPELRTYSLHRRLIVWLVIPMLVMSIAILVEASVSARESAQAIYRSTSPEEVPEEIKHVIHALNNLLDRIAGHVRNTKAFVETASHQLRTPLAALTTRIELARRDASTDWGRKAFDGIHRDTVRASRTADQLLSLARVEPEVLGGGFDDNVDLEDLCADVACDWVNRALARRVNLELEAGAGDLVVEGNTALLGEILNNLIDNALSYCPDGARITIRVGETSGPGVYLQVEDDGPGIPEHRRDDVFDRFVRLDPDIGRGCGLGLSIVKEITKVHHGEIRLSAPHSGTGLIVRIELPKVQSGRLAAAFRTS